MFARLVAFPCALPAAAAHTARASAKAAAAAAASPAAEANSFRWRLLSTSQFAAAERTFTPVGGAAAPAEPQRAGAARKPQPPSQSPIPATNTAKPVVVTNPISGEKVVVAPSATSPRRTSAAARRPTAASASTAQQPPSQSPAKAAAAAAAAAAVAEFSAARPVAAAPLEVRVEEALVNNLMRDGKKATARRVVQDALRHVQEASAAAVAADAAAASAAAAGKVVVDAGAANKPRIPTVPGTGLPLGPRALLAVAVERAEPLMKLVGFRRGAKSIQTPTPLTERQRRRAAIIWIKEAAEARNKRDSMGVRVGKELMAILQGESGVLQRRTQVHKAALLNRSNVVLVDRRVRRN
ncbi:hypothetical protein HK405_013298 [Cladochytrium tenue]|nr:hypothetical protein HK405_013298 [Cladochytrium tenue]